MKLKTLATSLAALPFLALAAAAQESAYTDLSLGDRVKVTFHSGSTITGTLIARPGGPKVESVDYTRERALMLDVSWDYPGLNGTMTIEKKEIAGVAKVRLLSPKELAELAAMKKRLAEEHAKPKPVEPPVPTEPAKPAAPPKADPPVDLKAAEELKKALEIYAKFPPPDWNPERYTVIQLKKTRGQLPTPAEREFYEGYTLWQKGQAAAAKKPAEPKKAP